ncbi:MAG: rubredoxin [Spirochaetales bacterium]|nr:rubredoxin [Spirochaetales bacterium]
MIVYQCSVCDYVYREDEMEEGNNNHNSFEDLPEDWRCPQCGSRKNCFIAVHVHKNSGKQK